VGQLSPPPAYVAHRIRLYDEAKTKRAAVLAERERTAIVVTLRDGKEVPGRAWETTPHAVAEGISKSLVNNTVVAKVCVPTHLHARGRLSDRHTSTSEAGGQHGTIKRAERAREAHAQVLVASWRAGGAGEWGAVGHEPPARGKRARRVSRL
jgi:hypothetical protein